MPHADFDCSVTHRADDMAEDMVAEATTPASATTFGGVTAITRPAGGR